MLFRDRPQPPEEQSSPLRIVAVTKFALLHDDSFEPPVPTQLFRFKRSHINYKAVLHIGLEQPFVDFVGLLDGDDFDIGSDVMFAAEVEHLLGFGDAADRRPRKTAAAHNQAECCDLQGLLRCADKGDVTVEAEEVEMILNGSFIYFW